MAAGLFGTALGEESSLGRYSAGKIPDPAICAEREASEYSLGADDVLQVSIL
jgi:hypothetical protein